MKRLIVVIVVLGALGVPAEAAAKAFVTYPTCEILAPRPDPDRNCVAGQAIGFVLRAFRQENVTYRVCWRVGGHKKCDRRVTGRRGGYSRKFIRVRYLGRYRVIWRSRGRVIDRDTLFVRDECTAPCARQVAKNARAGDAQIGSGSMRRRGSGTRVIRYSPFDEEGEIKSDLLVRNAMGRLSRSLKAEPSSRYLGLWGGTHRL